MLCEAMQLLSDITQSNRELIEIIEMQANPESPMAKERLTRANELAGQSKELQTDVARLILDALSDNLGRDKTKKKN